MEDEDLNLVVTESYCIKNIISGNVIDNLKIPESQ